MRSRAGTIPRWPTAIVRSRPRGARAAERICRHLEAEGIRPELVLCSPARRTRETVEALRPAIGTADVRIDDRIYGADTDEILECLHEVDARITSVMVVGHNPGLEELTADLAGDGDAAALAQLHTKFPTGALATLAIADAGWDQLRRGHARLTRLVVPRQLALTARTT